MYLSNVGSRIHWLKNYCICFIFQCSLVSLLFNLNINCSLFTTSSNHTAKYSSDADNPESCHWLWLLCTFQIEQNCLIQSYSCRNLSLLCLSRPFPTSCHLFPLPRGSLWRRRRGIISPWAETAVSILELTCRQLLDCQSTVEPGVEYCATFVVLR